VVCAASIFWLRDDARSGLGAAKTKWPVERFPDKWKPVSRKKMLSINNLRILIAEPVFTFAE
jgi:hypothetical protein